MGCRRLLIALLGCAAGCTAGSPAAPPDAAVDAPTVEAVVVSCSGVTPAVEITTAGGEYAPSTPTIAVGEIVQWRLSAGHTAHSLPSGLFAIPQGEVGCVRFQVAGDYDFYCQVHGFSGVVHAIAP